MAETADISATTRKDKKLLSDQYVKHDISELDELIGFHLRRAQSLLFSHFREVFQDQGVTPGQVGILCLIRNNPGISQTALARTNRIERATLGEILAYLENMGWIERREAPNDRRAKALYLSNKGKSFLKKLLPAIRDHERHVSQHLNREESAQLLRLLRKFVNK